MQLARPAIAADPRAFGRAEARELAEIPQRSGLGDDLKLFGTTFLAGFVFVSLLIA